MFVKPLFAFLLAGLTLVGCSATQHSPADKLVTPKETSTASTDPLVRGASLYAENCAGCHGAKGEGGSPMLQGKPIHFNEPDYLKDMTDTEIQQTILNGRGNMPAFATTLTQEDVVALTQYLRNLPKSGQ